MSEEKKNILHMMYDKDGYPTWQTQLSPEENKTRATCCIPPDRVMPVVFIPGIMGSNLKFIKKLDGFKDNIAWRPDDGYYTAITFGNLKPAKRRQVLDPKNTVIDESGEIPDSLIRFFKNVSPNVQANWKTEFTRRGWGALNLDSYGDILCHLEWNLNRIYDPNLKASLVTIATVDGVTYMDANAEFFAEPNVLNKPHIEITLSTDNRMHQGRTCIFQKS